jgi:hypothetical protein
MTTKEFVSLEKCLLLELPGLALERALMFIPPAAPILRGISFEGSSFDKTSFSVTMFVMLLCVPTKHLHLGFANGVRHKGGGDRWSKDIARFSEGTQQRTEDPSHAIFVECPIPPRLC